MTCMNTMHQRQSPGVDRLPGLVGGLAGALPFRAHGRPLLGAVAVLPLGTIKDWLRGLRAADYGEITKRDLRNGDVTIVAIGLTWAGIQTGEKTWTAKLLDQDLAAAFGYSQRARITL
jgi:hypothetical protein